MDDAWQDTADAEFTPQIYTSVDLKRPLVINKTLIFFENCFCHALEDIKILQQISQISMINGIFLSFKSESNTVRTQNMTIVSFLNGSWTAPHTNLHTAQNNIVQFH